MTNAFWANHLRAIDAEGISARAYATREGLAIQSLYQPKGTDLSGFTQDDLNAIAWKLNNRPRKIHGFRTPLQVYNEMLQMAQMSESVAH
jgi:hypothetical protein